ELAGAAARFEVGALGGFAEGFQGGHADLFQLALGVFPLGELAAAQLLDELVDPLGFVVGDGRLPRQAAETESQPQEQGQEKTPVTHGETPYYSGRDTIVRAPTATPRGRCDVAREIGASYPFAIEAPIILATSSPRG